MGKRGIRMENTCSNEWRSCPVRTVARRVCSRQDKLCTFLPHPDSVKRQSADTDTLSAAISLHSPVNIYKHTVRSLIILIEDNRNVRQENWYFIWGNSSGSKEGIISKIILTVVLK